MIFLKPAFKCDYKTTVKVLDEMTVNKIKKYTMVNPSDIENSFLKIQGFPPKTSELIETKTPFILNTEEIKEKIPYLLFTLTDKKTLYYEYKGVDATSGKIEVFPLSTESIKNKLNAIEDEYNISLNNINILIKGEQNVRYPEFEKLIEALKKKELYKYKLVTK